MKTKEFLTFLLNKDVTPIALKKAIHTDIRLSFQGPQIIFKFLLYQIMGALFSLSVCPQFGLGLVEGHGITHAFRMIGDWACASFCGSLFLSSGLMVAFIGMKGEELWWVWRRYKFSLIILPAVLWSGLMLTNMTLDLPDGESSSYHFIWIGMGVFIQYLFLQMRSYTYARIYIRDL